MAFYLQDSGSAYWQLGVSTSGQWTMTSVGAQSIVTLVVQDTSGGYWQLGVTTSGQLTLASVGATSTTYIAVADSNGVTWVFGATTNGQPTSTVQIPQLIGYQIQVNDNL